MPPFDDDIMSFACFITSAHLLTPMTQNFTIFMQSFTLRWIFSWWRHQIKTFSALLAIYAGSSPVTGEFPAQRPLTRSSDISFDLRQTKWLSKQWWSWWFETPPCPLWRHRNASKVKIWRRFYDGIYNGCGVFIRTFIHFSDDSYI